MATFDQIKISLSNPQAMQIAFNLEMKNDEAGLLSATVEYLAKTLRDSDSYRLAAKVVDAGKLAHDWVNGILFDVFNGFHSLDYEMTNLEYDEVEVWRALIVYVRNRKGWGRVYK